MIVVNLQLEFPDHNPTVAGLNDVRTHLEKLEDILDETSDSRLTLLDIRMAE